MSTKNLLLRASCLQVLQQPPLSNTLIVAAHSRATTYLSPLITAPPQGAEREHKNILGVLSRGHHRA